MVQTDRTRVWLRCARVGVFAWAVTNLSLNAATAQTAATAKSGEPASGAIGKAERRVPVGSEVVTRDDEGHATVRAVRLTAPLRVDGRLDETAYTSSGPAADFIQTEPRDAVPATEKTEVWVFYDERHVYFAAKCWESAPDHIVVNEMRRDGTNIGQNDNLAWNFDTLNDRRNGVLFEINSIGGRMDGQTTNEDSTNFDWNPVWDVKVAKFEGGWSVEAAVPFKSLRYRPGRDPQTWGFNVRRRNRWKNEISYLSAIPRAMGIRGLRPSLNGRLVGIETPSSSRTLEVKPFTTSALTTDRFARPEPLSNDPRADGGVDVKYSVTRSLTADATVRTDFAQVEADENQVNLTRFNLLFPEKREFFLENRGTFQFGGDGADTPILFYSRRIGLNGNRLVPIRGGGRLTGRTGAFSVGALNIQSGAERVSGVEPTNFSVFRVKRDLFRQSNVGVIYTSRSIGSSNNAPRNTLGVDGTFAFLANRLQVATYWAKTPTEAKDDHDASYRAQMDYTGERWGWQVEHLAVGDNFRPDVGFVRRDNMRKSYGQIRFSQWPKGKTIIRRTWYTGTLNHIKDDDFRLQTREFDGELALDFKSTDRMTLGATNIYEFLPGPFEISPRVILPIGGYDFVNYRASYNFGQQRRVAANVLAERGTFYNGTRTAVTVSQGRIKFTNQFSLQPIYTFNRVRLDNGAFTQHLPGARVTHTFTPLMFASALVQYNSISHILSANVRLRWEYRPGSELFVVLNEQRDSTGQRFPSLTNRALIVKINRLLQF